MVVIILSDCVNTKIVIYFILYQLALIVMDSTKLLRNFLLRKLIIIQRDWIGFGPPASSLLLLLWLESWRAEQRILQDSVERGLLGQERAALLGLHSIKPPCWISSLPTFDLPFVWYFSSLGCKPPEVKEWLSFSYLYPQHFPGC